MVVATKVAKGLHAWHSSLGGFVLHAVFCISLETQVPQPPMRLPDLTGDARPGAAQAFSSSEPAAMGRLVRELHAATDVRRDDIEDSLSDPSQSMYSLPVSSGVVLVHLACMLR